MLRSGKARATPSMEPFMRGDDDAVVDERAYLVKDGSLRGIPVFSPSGKKLGVLDEVIINKNCGAITYAVLCCTSLMGLRKKRHVLPSDALTMSERSGFAVVDGRVTVADQLTNKPEREAVPAAAAYRLDPARSV